LEMKRDSLRRNDVSSDSSVTIVTWLQAGQAGVCPTAGATDLSTL